MDIEYTTKRNKIKLEPRFMKDWKEDGGTEGGFLLHQKYEENTEPLTILDEILKRKYA